MAIFIDLVAHHVLRRRSASADAGVGVFRDTWSSKCCQRLRTIITFPPFTVLYSGPFHCCDQCLRIDLRPRERVGNRDKETDRGGYEGRVVG